MPQSTKDKQVLLEEIVQTWIPNRKPEFRAFRCAKCQQYITKSWHHVLDSKEYLVPVHVCDKCQRDIAIEGGEYKSFQCDQCATEVTEAWHIWGKEGSKLVESHLCRNCGKQYD